MGSIDFLKFCVNRIKNYGRLEFQKKCLRKLQFSQAIQFSQRKFMSVILLVDMKETQQSEHKN